MPNSTKGKLKSGSGPQKMRFTGLGTGGETAVSGLVKDGLRFTKAGFKKEKMKDKPKGMEGGGLLGMGSALDGVADAEAFAAPADDSRRREDWAPNERDQFEAYLARKQAGTMAEPEPEPEPEPSWDQFSSRGQQEGTDGAYVGTGGSPGPPQPPPQQQPEYDPFDDLARDRSEPIEFFRPSGGGSNSGGAPWGAGAAAASVAAVPAPAPSLPPVVPLQPVMDGGVPIGNLIDI